MIDLEKTTRKAIARLKPVERDTAKDKRERKAAEEEIRLYYVAVSRAKVKLTGALLLEADLLE